MWREIIAVNFGNQQVCIATAPLTRISFIWDSGEMSLSYFIWVYKTIC